MIGQNKHRAAHCRGTQNAEPEERFLTGILSPHTLRTRADALQMSRNLFLEFINHISKANTQRCSDLGACQKARLALMALDEADGGTRDTDLLGQRIMRKPLLLAEPGKFINDFFDQ